MFSIFRESSGLTFIFINATKQYLKSWVSSSLINALSKIRDILVIGSPYSFPVNQVHIFPAPLLGEIMNRINPGSQGRQVGRSSYRIGVLAVQVITRYVNEKCKTNAVMRVPFTVPGFLIIASLVNAERKSQRALNFTVPIQYSATL